MSSSTDRRSMSEKTLIDEREEVMVSEKGYILKKSHFLEPSINSGIVAELPRHHRHKKLRSLNPRNLEHGFRIPEAYFISWLEKMEALHGPIWEKAGIFEAIKVSTYHIVKNPTLILSVSEQWCPETKSFLFPWGEATITLEDVMVLLGFSVLGSPVFVPLETSEMKDSEKKLHLEKMQCGSDCQGSVSKLNWFKRFSGIGGELEHEAFLVLWLSYFVFPSQSRPSISENVIPIAIRLARGERIALAPAVLACVYRDLDLIVENKVNYKSLLKLVQVWTWERFKGTRPKGLVREIAEGEPRISRWGSLSQSYTSLSFDEFEWRPYTKHLKNWNPLQYYVDEAMSVTIDDGVFPSLVKCVRASLLVGDGFVESYNPNRVAMQLGFDQDLPGSVTRGGNLTGMEAWDDYNTSLNGLKLYIPSRLARGSVSKRYYHWWLKSFHEMDKETSESSNAREIVDHYDDDEEEDYDDDDGDQEMTIAERVRSKKKYSDGGDGSATLGKRSRRYMVVETDDSDSDETPREAQEEMQICEDGTKEPDQEDGEKLCSEVKNEEEEIDERMKQRKLRIDELALKLKARLTIMEKGLAMMRDWKTRGRKIKQEGSA